MSVENDVYTIVLNKNWEFTGETKTVKDTMTQFLSQEDSNGWEAICIDYKEQTDSKTGDVTGYDYSNYTIKTVSRNEWYFQPVFKYSPFIKCANNRIMRIPTVLIAKNYGSMPKRLERVTKTAIWKQDNYICQLTGKDTQIIGSTWSNMFSVLLTNAFSIVGTIMGIKYATQDGSKQQQ